MKDANRSKILLWASIVYILSFMCYFPALLKQHGIDLAPGLLRLKYLFVCIPAISAVFLLICEHNLKAYFRRMFSGKISSRHILTWAAFVMVGILISNCYSLISGVDVFQNTYSSITALLASCVYLFMTGLVEEIAWRGFFLERISCQEKSSCNIIFVGIIWAVWHMPMWIIRNSLDMEQIIYLCIWTNLVSYVLGTTYYQCRNVVLIAMLHAAFNISYLAPIQYNIAAIAIVIAIAALLMEKHKGLKK